MSFRRVDDVEERLNIIRSKPSTGPSPEEIVKKLKANLDGSEAKKQKLELERMKKRNLLVLFAGALEKYGIELDLVPVILERASKYKEVA